MNITVHIAMFSWPFVVLALFGLLRPRRAVIAAFLFAWLFLPMAAYSIEGLPDYTKVTATSYGVLMGVAIFDAGRLSRFRPSWIDIPMAVWCFVPLASCISNNIGGTLASSLYGGANQSFYQISIWGIPWLIGRLYFSDVDGLRELALGIFIGGLIYVPLCLWETRMSPQLHHDVYGYKQQVFMMNVRYGGYRPIVFMQSALAVALWLANASLVGLWLWRTGVPKRLWGLPMGWLVTGLVGTLVLCKTLGALVLFVAGAVVIMGTGLLRSRILIIALLVAPPVYMIGRGSGVWSGESLVASAALINEERARSLEWRMWNEDLYIDHTMARPLLGWTSWHFQVYDDRENRLTTSDGLWIIALSKHGLIGLVSLFVALLLPVTRIVWRCTPHVITSAWMAPPVILALTVLLFAIDSLFNAMVNPLFALAAGGLATLPVAALRRVCRTAELDANIISPESTSTEVHTAADLGTRRGGP
jgi:hypothetical protein